MDREPLFDLAVDVPRSCLPISAGSDSPQLLPFIPSRQERDIYRRGELMSLIRRAVLFTTLLVVASASFSQDAATTPTASQGVAPLPTATTATKDPDAVKALQNASAATLGFVALPQNLTGAGKMTRFSGDQTPASDVTWKATSSGGVRIDAKFDGYPTTLLVSYGYARTADD